MWYLFTIAYTCNSCVAPSDHIHACTSCVGAVWPAFIVILGREQHYMYSTKVWRVTSLINKCDFYCIKHLQIRQPTRILCKRGQPPATYVIYKHPLQAWVSYSASAITWKVYTHDLYVPYCNTSWAMWASQVV